VIITCFGCFKNGSIDNEYINLIINDKLTEKSGMLSIDVDKYKKKMVRDSKLNESNITKGTAISFLLPMF
jgi:hypothetical protein